MLKTLRSRTAGLGLLACVAAFACAQAKAPKPVPSHVLLFTFGGLRADHVSSLAYVRPTTAGAPDDPNFEKKPGLDYDALASRGVQFPNCFVPTLDPGQALVSLLSGQSPSGTGADANGGRGTSPRLAEVLQSAGFHTIACVTPQQAGQKVDAQAALGRGFDIFEAHERDNDAVARAWLHAKAAFENESVDRIFVWVHLSEIQAPFDAAELPSIITERKLAGYFSDPAYAGSADGSLEFLARASSGEARLALEDKEQIIAAYDSEVARATALMRAFLERWVYTVRDSFGTYVDAPHEDARWAQTLVVACGTSGAELGEHEGVWGDASTLHDSSLRVPLFFSHPESLLGQRILSNVVGLSDVAPTICELLQLRTAWDGNGVSLVSSLDVQQDRAPERSAMAEASPQLRTLRTERWRLIQDVQSGSVSLFDLHRDPRELRDVAGEEPRVIEALLGQFDASKP